MLYCLIKRRDMIDLPGGYMAAYREALTINSFTTFGTGDQIQEAHITKKEDETMIWMQTAIILKTQ